MADIVARIRKLKQLSQHNNSPEEAASAAAQAQELMFRYQIGEADLDIEGQEERQVEAVVDEAVAADRGTRRCVWKACLGAALAHGFGCKLYTWKENGQVTFRVVGLQSAVQTVNYVFAFLTREIQSMSRVAFAAHGSGSSRTWMNSFRMGAVSTIRERMEAQKAAQEAEVKAREAQTTALALYRTDQERVDNEYEGIAKRRGLRTVRHRQTYAPTAYMRGATAARDISLDASDRPGIPASKPRVEA